MRLRVENWNGNVLQTVEGLSFRGDTGCQMLMKAAGLVGITGVFDCACWRRTRESPCLLVFHFRGDILEFISSLDMASVALVFSDADFKGSSKKVLSPALVSEV